MNRLLASALFAYAGLSAAQWGHASQRLSAPHAGLWCGNVISDPYNLLVGVVSPAAAVCAFVLACRCIKARRWPCRAVTALLTFIIASACLAYEAHVLGRYGLEVGRVWWVPWR